MSNSSETNLPGIVWLDSLDLTKVCSAGNGNQKVIAGKNVNGKAISMSKQVFEHGLAYGRTA
jgi:hypothetical protein